MAPMVMEKEIMHNRRIGIRDFKNTETLKGLSGGDIFAMITNGKGNMPDQEGRLKDDQKWKMANCIRKVTSAPDRSKPGK